MHTNAQTVRNKAKVIYNPKEQRRPHPVLAAAPNVLDAKPKRKMKY